jgi:hypothetical protein
MVYFGQLVAGGVVMRKTSYLPMEQVMQAIAGQFVNLVQYRSYIKANNLVSQGFPLHPEKVYDNYPLVDKFLGNRPGTYALWQSNDMTKRKPWIHAQIKIANNLKKEIQEQQVAKYSSIVELYIALLNHGASTDTLSSYLNDVKPNPDQLKELIEVMLNHTKRHQSVKV